MTRRNRKNEYNLFKAKKNNPNKELEEIRILSDREKDALEYIFAILFIFSILFALFYAVGFIKLFI